MTPAISTFQLTRRYKHVEALEGLDLEVPAGAVYAYLGPNGAGKTTTIHLLMNLIRPSSGRAEVLGVECARLGAQAFESIGYVSENQRPPEWMKVGEFLTFCRELYPTWDETYCASLLEMLDLPTDREIRHCSRGMRMKTALISSSAYRPKLLVLDEPFSGLDPTVRDDMIRAMQNLTRETGCTIFISSHDLMEVEALADHVGYLANGRLRLSEPLDSLKTRFRRIEVNGESIAEKNFDPDETPRRLRERYGPDAKWEVHPLSLREIFSELGRGDRRMS